MIWEFPNVNERQAGEKVRLAYEKKCALLRSQDANGAEPIAIEKTRVVVRDLRTKLDISLTSVDAVSRRIAAVRDDELLPQLMQLVRGYVLPRPRNNAAIRTNCCHHFCSLIDQAGEDVESDRGRAPGDEAHRRRLDRAPHVLGRRGRSRSARPDRRRRYQGPATAPRRSARGGGRGRARV